MLHIYSHYINLPIPRYIYIRVCECVNLLMFEYPKTSPALDFHITEISLSEKYEWKASTRYIRLGIEPSEKCVIYNICIK